MWVLMYVSRWVGMGNRVCVCLCVQIGMGAVVYVGDLVWVLVWVCV